MGNNQKTKAPAKGENKFLKFVASHKAISIATIAVLLAGGTVGGLAIGGVFSSAASNLITLEEARQWIVDHPCQAETKVSEFKAEWNFLETSDSGWSFLINSQKNAFISAALGLMNNFYDCYYNPEYIYGYSGLTATSKTGVHIDSSFSSFSPHIDPESFDRNFACYDTFELTDSGLKMRDTYAGEATSNEPTYAIVELDKFSRVISYCSYCENALFKYQEEAIVNGSIITTIIYQ